LIFFSFGDTYIGGQHLEGSGMGFHWWLWSAYISFWWQAVGFTIVWVLKIQLIE